MSDPGEGTSNYLSVSEIDRIIDSCSEYEGESSGDSFKPGSSQSSLYSGESDTEDNEEHVTVATSDSRPQPVKIWVDNPNSMETYIFTQQPGLRIPFPDNSEPIDFFALFVEDVYLHSIVRHTNIYAERLFLSEGTLEGSRITNWKDLTINELKVFLGLLLHTGIVRMPNLQDYWKKDKMFKTCFGEYMSRDRFLLILRCLHFADNDKDDKTDRLFKIRHTIEHFNNKMYSLYSPGKELSLDESMMLWRGRLIFKQYIKNKRHKYGIKFYTLAEPNGLVLKFCIYAGANDVLSGEGHKSKVVMHLMEERLGRGHSLYMDNFYNSVELSKRLLNDKTYVTGTLRADLKGNPKDVTSKTLKKGESFAKYCEGVMVGRWRDKWYVLYTSTQYENVMTTVINKRGQEIEKPLPVAKYNEYMSGVDRNDQAMSYYACERKVLRWHKKVFIHILEMTIINSHILFNKYTIGKKMSLMEFRIKLIKSLLATGTTNEVEVVTPKQKPVDHFPTKLPLGTNNKTKRKRCLVCYKNGKRKDTVYQCEACPEKPPLCIGDCFKKHHG